MRFYLLCLLGRGQKLRFLFSKKNSLFEKRLSDKLTTFPKGSILHDGYDYLRFHRVVGFLSLSGFIVQLVDCFLKLPRMFFWYCTRCYFYFFLLGLVDQTLVTSYGFAFLVFVHDTWVGDFCRVFFLPGCWIEENETETTMGRRKLTLHI